MRALLHRPGGGEPSGLRGNRGYALYWNASLISGLGSQLSSIAYPLLVLSLGGRAAQAGAVASCSMITRTVFRMPAGHIADRVDRRRLMLAMDLIRLLAVGSIPLADALGRLGYPQLLAVAVIEGLGTALFGPASSILVRDVVPKELLTRAFSRNQAKMGTLAVIGPALSGLCFTIDRILPFTADAASYAVSAVLLLGVRVRPAPRPREEGADRGVTAGLRWLRSRSDIMRLLTYVSVMNLIAAALEVVVVVGLRQHGARSSVIGLVVACAGIGGIAGAVLAERILARVRPAVLYLTVGLIWSAGLAVFAVAPVPGVIGPVLTLMILLTPPIGIKLAQITAGEAPRELLGRVTTAEGTISSGLGAVGPLLIGVLMERAGVSTAWTVLAVLSLLATAAAAVPLLRADSAAQRPAAHKSPDSAAPDGGAQAPDDSDLDDQDPDSSGTVHADPSSRSAAEPVGDRTTRM
jgi:MFS family permease